MKHIYLFVVSIIALLGISSCERESKTLYAIRVTDKIVCTSTAQMVDVDYSVHENILNSNVIVSVTSSESWVSVGNSSVIGEITLHVEENSGENRSAKITISAPGCVSTSFTLMQYGTPPEVANHTLIFYFFGTSLDRYFKTNIEDAIKAIDTGILGNSNRVIIFRQKSKYEAYISELCYDVDGGECIEQRHVENITLPTPLITPEDIGGYIKQMADIAPAKRYGIVFASHGQGWIPREVLNGDGGISALSTMNVWQPAIGAEVTRAFGENNVQVNPAELAEGIEKSGVELDYILFDACFMSNIETIYDLRSAASYIIASPCEIMGKGFPYHRTLPYLFQNDGTTTDYVGAAESYYKFYRDEYSSTSRCGSIAVFDCREIETLVNATSQVIKSAKSNDDIDVDDLQTYEGQNVHQFYDFGEWVNTVATDKEALKAFNDQLNKTVVAKYSLPTFYSAYGSYGTYNINLDVYSGVTTSAPSEAYPEYWKKTNWYKAVWE